MNFRLSLPGALILFLLPWSIGAFAAPPASKSAGTGAATSTTTTSTATAAATSNLAKGYQCYQQKSFNAACAYFVDAIDHENAGAVGWLYLGHSQYSMGRLEEAKTSYRKIRELYPTSPQASVAATCLARLEPQAGAAKSQAVASLKQTGEPVAGASGQSLDATLLSRVKVGFWMQDHPPVAPATVALIKENITKLPDPVKTILVNGGIKFCVCGTLVDQYPSLRNTVGKGYDGQTLKRCPGMFSRDTVNVCQNVMNEATDEVEPALRLSDMSQTFYHELGHALDACGDSYSLSPEYRHCYWLDIARIPDDAATRLCYYMQKSDTGQRESCAEITAVILGGADRHAEEIKTYFPLTIGYLRKKLNMP